ANGRPVRCCPNASNVDPIVAVGAVEVEEIVLWTCVRTVRHEEVKKTVVVVVSPNAGDRFPAIMDDAAGGDFAKLAIAVIVIKKVVSVPDIGYEQIQETVIIIITPASTKGIA